MLKTESETDIMTYYLSNSTFLFSPLMNTLSPETILLNCQLILKYVGGGGGRRGGGGKQKIMPWQQSQKKGIIKNGGPKIPFILSFWTHLTNLFHCASIHGRTENSGTAALWIYFPKLGFQEGLLEGPL